MKGVKVIIYICIFLGTFCNVFADKQLQVGTIERPPFSYKEDGEWTGFSIDLWKEIAQKGDISYSFVEYTDFSEMIASTQLKEVDLSVANISITLEREKVMDFSQPIFDSWLNILARVDKVWDVTSFISPVFVTWFLKGLLYFAIFLWILTHFFRVINVVRWNIWLLSYFTEIFPIFFEVLSQLREWYGYKIMFALIISFSIFLVSFYSQKIAIVFADYDQTIKETTASEYNNINIADIAWEKIWVTEWSTSMQYLTQRNLSVIPYRNFDSMITDLEAWNIDLVVHDDPLLKYLVRQSPEKKLVVVWKTFQSEKFGIAFSEWFLLRESIDRTILKMMEQWEYQKIYNNYF